MGGQKLPIPFGNPATYKGHSGVDFGQPRGTPFRASGPGRITSRAKNARGGYYVWVQYDAGPRVGYHHMDSHRGVPAPGTRVAEGTLLGYVGSLGQYSTGPHLHSEVSGHATTDGYWRFFDPNRVVGTSSSGGNAAGSEDDMFESSDRALLKELRTEILNTKAGVWTGGVSNGQKFNYGALPIVAHNQTLIGQLTVQVGALSAAVQALAAASGADPAAILAAVENGVKDAMKDVTFSVDIDS